MSHFEILVDPEALVSALFKIHNASIPASLLKTFDDARHNPQLQKGYFMIDSIGRGLVYFKQSLESNEIFEVESAVIHPTYQTTRIIQKLILSAPVSWTIRIPSALHSSSNLFWKSCNMRDYYDESDAHYFEGNGKSSIKVPQSPYILVEV